VDLRRQLRNKGGERERERHLQEDGPLLVIDYTMRYESMHNDVTDYPKLFQNWTAHHLDGILDQMEFLVFGVLNVQVPTRIVLSGTTSSPIIAPGSSTNPSTATPTSSPTIVSTPNEKEPTSSFPISIIISLAFGIPFCLVSLLISLYCGYYKMKPTIFSEKEVLEEIEQKIIILQDAG